MSIHKLSTSDAFVAFDLDGAPSSGIVRSAPKILQGGAKDLARSLTYAFATLEMQRGGASAGINAQPDDRADAIAAFVDELTPMAADGSLSLDAGKGVSDVQLQAMADADDRAEVASADIGGTSLSVHLAGLGPVLAAENICGDLAGKTVAIEGFDDHGPALAAAATDRGATVIAISTPKGLRTEGLDPATLAELWASDGAAMVGEDADPAWKIFATAADILFAGSKIGAIDHDTAAKLAAKAVVPHNPLPFTARALAVMQRADIAVVADFISTSAPLLAGWPTGDTTPDAVIASATNAIESALNETKGHPDGAFLGACHQAEAYLSSWREELPFGRPLAG